jgi:hypothetical protein
MDTPIGLDLDLEHPLAVEGKIGKSVTYAAPPPHTFPFFFPDEI